MDVEFLLPVTVDPFLRVDARTTNDYTIPERAREREREREREV
jgi:hypothetical protein